MTALKSVVVGAIFGKNKSSSLREAETEALRYSKLSVCWARRIVLLLNCEAS